MTKKLSSTPKKKKSARSPSARKPDPNAKKTGRLKPKKPVFPSHPVPDPALFGELIENAVQGILVHRNFKPLYANRACAALFGYPSPKDLLKLPLIRSLIPADRWAYVEADYDELIRGRKGPVTGRTRVVKHGGEEIWLAITERVVSWPGGPAVEVTGFDITEQMAIEQAFLENEQRLRSILEVLPYPVYIARPDDGKLLFVNRKTCLLFHQSASNLLRSSSIDFYADPKEREDLRQLMETIPDIRNIEVRMRTSHAREFVAELAAIAMTYNGAPAFLVTLNDISLRKQMEMQLMSQATTDELTGLVNRRQFFVLAERELGRSQRFGRPLSAMMVDIDHFKSINDRHGHATGDGVLQGFVRRAQESLRTTDFMGRLGGEEFAIVMPETPLSAAEAAAERLRAHIASAPIISEREPIPVTVSVGVATFDREDKSVDGFLNRADKALYRAKHGGRNRIELAE